MSKIKAGWIGIIKNDDAFWKKAETAVEIGYKGMEGGDWLTDEGVGRFYDMGLKIITASSSPEALENKLDESIKRAQKLRTDRITVWAGQVNSSFWGAEPDYDKFMSELEMLEKSAEIASKEGIRITYHNHFQEFEVSFKGVKAFDYMLLNTEKLHFELDIAWSTFGGMNPCDAMKRIGKRLTSIHVKDYVPNPAKKHGVLFTSLGTGVVNVHEAVNYAAGMGLEWAVVEQDELRNLTDIETLTASYYNLKETGLLAE